MDLTDEGGVTGIPLELEVDKAVAEAFERALPPIDVFIGYTSVDSVLVGVLTDALARVEGGLEVWWMQGPSNPIPDGVNIRDASLKALKKSSLAVFVVSAAWLGKSYCRTEFKTAFREQSGGLPQRRSLVFVDAEALRSLESTLLAGDPSVLTENRFAMSEELRGSSERLALWAKGIAMVARAAQPARDKILGVTTTRVERPEQPASEELLNVHPPAPVSWETVFDVVSENDANICVRLRAGCQATGGITRALMTELGWCSRKQTWAMTRAQYEREFLPIVSRELGRL